MVTLETPKKWRKGLLVLLSFVVFIQGCQKDLIANDEYANVSISISETSFSAGYNNLATSKVSVTTKQNTQIPLDEKNYLDITIHSLKSSPIKQAANNESVKKEVLEAGTPYNVLVFDENKSFTELKKYTVGEPEQEKLLLRVGKKYNFIIYALANDEILPDINLMEGDDWNKAILKLDNNKDLMVSVIENYSVLSGANHIPVQLKHIFTQVSVILNTEIVGKITNIGSIYLDNTYQSSTINLSNTSDLKFSDAIKETMLNKLQPNTEYSALNEPNLIYIDGKNSHQLRFDKLSINGIEKTDLIIPNLNLQHGIDYQIDIQVKSFTTEYEGTIIQFQDNKKVLWAPGNLVYNDATDEYYFAKQTDMGDKWYYNWLIPSRLVTETISMSTMNHYEVERDPCTQVRGGKWRTPSKNLYSALIKTPGAATDWQYTNNGVHGDFYGGNSLEQMVKSPTDYLFFPAKDGEAYYWSWETDEGNGQGSNAFIIRMSGYNLPNAEYFIQSEEKTKVHYIRCVQEY